MLYPQLGRSPQPMHRTLSPPPCTGKAGWEGRGRNSLPLRRKLRPIFENPGGFALPVHGVLFTRGIDRHHILRPGVGGMGVAGYGAPADAWSSCASGARWRAATETVGAAGREDASSVPSLSSATVGSFCTNDARTELCGSCRVARTDFALGRFVRSGAFSARTGARTGFVRVGGRIWAVTLASWLARRTVRQPPHVGRGRGMALQRARRCAPRS